MIIHRLDLAVSLIDTTTGLVVEERDARFFKDGAALFPQHREEGLFLFLNIGREDFLLEAEISGYEVFREQIRYEALDENRPFYTIYLIPERNLRKGEAVLSLEGKIPQLMAIEAISLLRAHCAANEYNARKQELSVFRSNGSKELSDVHYGLLQGQKDSYIHIEVEKDLSEDRVKLSKPLTEEFSPKSPVYRVIFGQVKEDGSFILRLRDEADVIPVIIRYRQEDTWYSRKGEFHKLAMRGLFEEAVSETNERSKAL